jgi:hypothetical protein
VQKGLIRQERHRICRWKLVGVIGGRNDQGEETIAAISFRINPLKQTYPAMTAFSRGITLEPATGALCPLGLLELRASQGMAIDVAMGMTIDPAINPAMNVAIAPSVGMAIDMAVNTSVFLSRQVDQDLQFVERFVAQQPMPFGK